MIDPTYHDENVDVVSRRVATIEEQSRYLYEQNAQKRANKASTRPPEGGARWVWVLLVVISFAVMIARSISGG